MFDFLKHMRVEHKLPEGTVRREYLFYGRVQGVGFRYRAKYAAISLELTGWVENLDDGSVRMEIQGTPEKIDQVIPLIQRNDYIQITDMRIRELKPNPWERRFSVRGGTWVE